MRPVQNEDAISEVIGFILILGVIAVILSLYMVYVIPDQGREDEVIHMNEIRDEFDHYKMDVDSGLRFGADGSSFNTIITPSTLGITTSSGSFLSFQLLKPAASSGTVVIGGTDTSAKLSIVPMRYILQNATLNPIGPNHLYVNFKFSLPTSQSSPNGSVPLSWPDDYGASITEINQSDWKVWLNATPTLNSITRVSSNSTNLSANYRTDLTISIMKQGNFTAQGMVVKKNVSPGISYTVDLLDRVYGLDIHQFNLYIENSTYANVIQLNTSSSQPDYPGTPQELGSLGFYSSNNYWINQAYWYQMGCVFMDQSDGSVSRYTPPVTVSEVGNFTVVRVTEILLEGTGTQGGTSPVRVQTDIEIIPNPYGLASGIINADSVNISINSSNMKTADTWEGVFRKLNLTLNKGYTGPGSIKYVRSGLVNSLVITAPNLDLEVTRARLSVSLQQFGTSV